MDEFWQTSGDSIAVDVWWVPDCGYMHVERNPVSLPWHCPDGLTGLHARDDSDTPDPH